MKKSLAVEIAREARRSYPVGGVKASAPRPRGYKKKLERELVLALGRFWSKPRTVAQLLAVLAAVEPEVWG